MKRVILGLLLFGGLIACGRSEQTGSTGSAPDLPSTMMRLTGTAIPDPPTSTPYIPFIQNNMVELDTTIAGNNSHFDLTMRRDQLLHLTASTETFPYFEWSVEFDTKVFAPSINGQPYEASQGFEPYPPGGWIMKPLEEGTQRLVIQMRLDPCAGCNTVSRYTIYTVTVK